MTNKNVSFIVFIVYSLYTDSHVLSRKHPLASWFSTMLMCFASIILVNIILGEPPVTPFTNQRDLLTASIVWYLPFTPVTPLFCFNCLVSIF